MIVRCQQPSAACREISGLIGLAARRSSDARRRHSILHGHVARKQARETSIERKPKRIRRHDLATGITGRSAAVLSPALPFRISFPPDLSGQIAHHFNCWRSTLELHCRTMAPMGACKIAARPMLREIILTITLRAVIPAFRSRFLRQRTPLENSSGQSTGPDPTAGRLHRSGDADHPHHAAFLMFQDVAMKHPVPGIVRNQGDLDTFARRQQHRILPFLIRGRLAVPA